MIDEKQAKYDFIRPHIEAAKETLIAKKRFIPMFIIDSREGLIVVMAVEMMEDSEKKQALVEFIKSLLKKHSSDFYIFVSEGCIWSGKKEEGIDNIKKNKKESCIIINYEQRDKRMLTVIIRFTKKNSEIVFGNEEIIDSPKETGGRFQNLFE